MSKWRDFSMSDDGTWEFRCRQSRHECQNDDNLTTSCLSEEKLNRIELRKSNLDWTRQVAISGITIIIIIILLLWVYKCRHKMCSLRPWLKLRVYLLQCRWISDNAVLGLSKTTSTIGYNLSNKSCPMADNFFSNDPIIIIHYRCNASFDVKLHCASDTWRLKIYTSTLCLFTVPIIHWNRTFEWFKTAAAAWIICWY